MEKHMQGKKLFLHSTLIFVFLLSMRGIAIPIQTLIKKEGVITSPKEQFDHNIGADYILLNYTQFVDYWKKLEQESGRMKLVDIGMTTEGRTQWMAVITSPENHKKLDRYKEISKHLALAEGLTDEEARELAQEGRSVVCIDAGLHATEVVNAQALLEMTYQYVSRNDRETIRFLNDVILLLICSNPDGLDLVANWYMRKENPTERSYMDLPRLYHKYAGHDNNRDGYTVSLQETKNINRVLYQEWFPQIVYTQHQTGPNGTVMFCPPYHDPHNYNIDPLVILGIEGVGIAMHTRFAAEDKAGVCTRNEGSYTMWRSGSYRITPYFHNMIGINTEINGSPTPMEIPFILHWQLPRTGYIYPIAPQKWHLRQSIQYLLTADRAVLDWASKNREELLFNIYRMGKNSIKRGSADYWTITPKRIAVVTAAMRRDNPEQFYEHRRSPCVPDMDHHRLSDVPIKYFNKIFRDPDSRDARGYIIPSDQADFLTATKFANSLIRGGVTVCKANQSFEVGEKNYPQGSYIIKAAQAFRPHIRDMFEPQDYPYRNPILGEVTLSHYGVAGYTLAFQMGVEFDRILEGFEGPFEKIEGLAKIPTGIVTRPGSSGFLLSHQVNDSMVAVNRLLASAEEVYWIKHPILAEGKTFPAGTIYIQARDSTAEKLKQIAKQIGLHFEGINTRPRGEAFRLKPVRIGLWDRYGGAMQAGWARLLLERYDFDFELVYTNTLDAGNLNEKYDVLLFVDGAIPDKDRVEAPQPDPESIPVEWRDKLVNVSVSQTIPRLREFLENGGTILTIQSSTCLGFHLNLPISNALLDKETGTPLSPEQFAALGSIHQVRVDTSNPLAYGLPMRLDVVFDRSPVFKIQPGPSVKKVAWYDLDKPLRSGALWGSEHLRGGITVIEADVGKGKLFLFGPDIIHRTQAHGTYKFLFNGIYYGSAEKANL